MEDVNAIIWLHPDEGVLPYSKHKIDSTLVAGVYDGHGGRSTAAYVAAQLPHLLQKELLTNDGHSRIVPAAVTKQQLLSNVYHELDNEWAQQGHFEQSGSTAVTAMINKKNLVIANAGESMHMTCVRHWLDAWSCLKQTSAAALDLRALYSKQISYALFRLCSRQLAFFVCVVLMSASHANAAAAATVL